MQKSLPLCKQWKTTKALGRMATHQNLKNIFFRDIGTFLVRSINYGFQNEETSVTPKQGIVTCIPKEGKPKNLLTNWCPISLLNTAYQIASAGIANRLKLMLSKIIHSDQKGFMKGRYFGENIRLLYAVLLYTEIGLQRGGSS